MKIVLLRHGESVSAAQSDGAVCLADEDNPLTPNGIARVESFAAAAARALNRPRVLSSDMRRARESAAVVAAALETEVEIRPELQEVLSVDTELAHEALRRQFRQFWERFYLGDGSDATIVRARRNADRVCATLRERGGGTSDLILVSHGGMIELLMARLFAGYARVGYTVEYVLAPGAFHLLELTARAGDIRHLRLHGANCTAFPEPP